MTKLKYDEIGYWSELKLDIVREYAKAYSVIMNRQRAIKKHIYIDAFAGAGHHISKTTKEFVQGSPLNALLVEPKFSEFHLIDLDGDKTEALRRLTKDNQTFMSILAMQIRYSCSVFSHVVDTRIFIAHCACWIRIHFAWTGKY